ncbi:YczE/YyaS/YitT family protein [Companilactobacillus sp. DQM5]|uniref:YczE/YyaS/YitT family protein n=1 Tax=Companilactobacillus sp. DQM5 TaxID=3463359 RepID=UPI004059C4AE
MNKMFLYFIFSIFLNSFANALTISTNLGSALWTASAANLSKMLGINLGNILFVYGIVVIVLNSILLKEMDWARMLGNFIFIIPFSYLVQFFTFILNNLHIINLPIGWRLFLDIIGIVLIAVAISIYQRVNLVLHPNDDLSYILRFKYFKGNPEIAQIVSFIPPIILILICYLIEGNIVAVNVGTVIALLFQGVFIGIADKIVFKDLKHDAKFLK